MKLNKFNSNIKWLRFNTIHYLKIQKFHLEMDMISNLWFLM